MCDAITIGGHELAVPESPGFVQLCLIGGVGQYCLTQAFRYGEAAAIAPLEYLSMVWALLLGYVIWNDIPEYEVFVGIALVVASGMFILYRERHLSMVHKSELPKVRVR